jgi:hypothetical protein
MCKASSAIIVVILTSPLLALHSSHSVYLELGNWKTRRIKKRHIQRYGKVLKGTTCQNPLGNCVQLQNGGLKPLFGPLAPVRMLGLLPAASYQAAQDTLKSVAHSLHSQVIHVSSDIPIHMHLDSERLAPCVERVQHLARILLWLVCDTGQTLTDWKLGKVSHSCGMGGKSIIQR